MVHLNEQCHDTTIGEGHGEGSQLYEFHADYALGEHMPNTIQISGHPPGGMVKTGIDSSIVTTEASLEGGGLGAAVWWGGMLLVAFVFLVVVQPLAVLILGDDERLEVKPFVVVAAVLAIPAALTGYGYYYGPAWWFLGLQWVGGAALVFGGLVALMLKEDAKRSRLVGLSMLGMCCIQIAVVGAAGVYAGEVVIIDNASDGAVVVVVTDGRGRSEPLLVPARTFIRDRIAGWSWQLESRDAAGGRIDSLSVRRYAGVWNGIVRWFVVPGECCYSIGGWNRYELKRVRYQ
ncbi:MAG: hypothetical protein PF961_23520 [Planctomycetota bacterium]|nr:hypothetical protein [Planctomycetota bacterium]